MSYYNDCGCYACEASIEREREEEKAEQEEMRELVKQYRPDNKVGNLTLFNFFYQKSLARRKSTDNRIASAIEEIVETRGFLDGRNLNLIQNLGDYFAYLDALLDSKLINMVEVKVVPHLQHNFPELDRREAGEVHWVWVRNLDIEEQEWKRKAEQKRIEEHKRKNGR